MFKLKSLNKKGFGHVEMIVFAFVLLAIGGIGYFALNSSSARKSVPGQDRPIGKGGPNEPAQPSDGLYRYKLVNESEVEVDYSGVFEEEIVPDDHVEPNYAQADNESYIDKYYEISGTTAKKINTNLEQPREFSCNTWVKKEWYGCEKGHYQYYKNKLKKKKLSDGKCKIIGHVVPYTSTVWKPRWIDYLNPESSQLLRNRWNTFIENIQYHENYHRINSKELTPNYNASIKNKIMNCSDTKQYAINKWSSAVRNKETKDREFDKNAFVDF